MSCILFRIGEHCEDAMAHKLLDKHAKKIIYRSSFRPITTANPNHRLDIDGGESSTSTGSSEGSKIQIPKVSTVFIRSRQDADPSIVKPMLEFDPDDFIVTHFFPKLRLCSCGTKAQHSRIHQYL